MGTASTRSDDYIQLLALNRQGELVSEYDRVRELLAAMPHGELMRAGNILARLDPDEIARRYPDTKSVKIFITGHGTLSTLKPPLTAELARHGILLRPRISEFDHYIFDLSDPCSALYAYAADLTICVLDPTIIFDEVPLPWRPPDVERVLREKLDLIERLVITFVAAGRGTLVLNTMPLPSHFTAQLIDHRSRSRLGRIWHEGSARLLELADRHPNVVIVDLDPLLAEGIAATDARLCTYAASHLSPSLLERYSRELAHLARHLTGVSKKVLILDLDGTMWDGVLGDDGLENIDVTGGPRGAAFRNFRKAVKQIGSQGPLLAVVSKNNSDLVHEAMQNIKHMNLTTEDFVQVIANWQPKHKNIIDISKTLNLGLSSFVFADDSPHECGLVRGRLPEVTVIQLDSDPAFHASKLLRDGWFDVIELTDTDRIRAVQYRENFAREDFLHSHHTIEEYLSELQLEVRLARAQPQEIPRVSQLTLRTNQFNLTTRRLQQPDVRNLATEPAWRVIAVHARDRFGDHGLVGAIFTRRSSDVVHIDNFLLSCRVFSRGIEQACISAILRQALEDGATAVSAEYRKTARNSIVQDLYPQHGFVTLSDDGATAVFRHYLNPLVPPPAHISLVDDI